MAAVLGVLTLVAGIATVGAGYQVDRRRDPYDGEPQPELVAPRHPRIAQETAEEHQQVRDQRRELPRLRSPPERYQREDHDQPEGDRDAEPDENITHDVLKLLPGRDLRRRTSTCSRRF